MNPLIVLSGLIAVSIGLVMSAAIIGGHVNLPTATPASTPTTSSTPIALDTITETEEKPGEYRNTLYGFAFTYPTTSTLETSYGADLLNLSITGDIAVGVPALHYRENARSTEEAYRNYLSATCGADGPAGSLFCDPKLMTFSSYTSADGARGFRVTRIKVNEQFLPEKKTTKYAETAYVFPIDAPRAFCVVLLPDISAKQQPDALKSIADSFRFIPRE